MTYDTSTDALQDALAVMCVTEVTNALGPIFGSTTDYPAVRETRRYPVPIEMIEALRLPLMAVFVEREIGAPMTMRTKEQRLTYVFDYLMPQTPIAKLELRWPALRKVWVQLLKSIREGAAGGVPNALNLAGAQRILEETATVVYDHATSGEHAYPHFTGRIDFIWREPTTQVLDDLVGLFADINRVDGNPAIQPQVQFQSLVP